MIVVFCIFLMGIILYGVNMLGYILYIDLLEDVKFYFECLKKVGVFSVKLYN